MGFSVTSAHVIFAIALLGAGSVASSTYFQTADHTEEAKRTAAARANDLAHTTLTLSGPPGYDAGAQRFTFNITNAGTTVLVISDFEYIVDGIWNNDLETGYPKITGVATTDVLLPGETMEVRLTPVATSPNNLRIVAGNGAAATWSA